MNDNEIILKNEYDKFYKKFYNIEADHTNAVKCISIIKKYIKNKNSHILEYGCASGFNLRYFQNEGYYNLVGIDGFKSFIEEAINKNDNIKYQNLNFNESRYPDYKNKFNKFDVIFTRGVLQQGNTRKEKIKNNDSDVTNILKYLTSMLNDNGTIILCEGNVRNWEKLIKKSDLKIVKKLQLYHIYITKKNLSLRYKIKKILFSR